MKPLFPWPNVIPLQIPTKYHITEKTGRVYDAWQMHVQMHVLGYDHNLRFDSANNFCMPASKSRDYIIATGLRL